jgi:AhpD family alkylhydroperoxidase
MKTTAETKTIAVPIKEQVSAEAQVLFDQLQKRLGKVPNLYATIGYSAPALKGLLELESNLSHGAFNAKEREAIALVVSEVNECAYCLAAHTMLALGRGFSQAETLAIRSGRVGDPKLEAAIQLAQSMAANKGKTDGGLLEKFFGVGYNEAALMELVGLVAVRTFTNYVYSLTDIPVDFPPAQPLH